MAHRNSSSPYDIVGPAALQALQLARYQALRDIGKEIVPATNENDVINQKVTPEEARILASNAAVVSALEDLFSWMHKDRTSKTSRLSHIESWRFRRALYRVWMVSTLFGFGSGPRTEGAVSTQTEQKAFLRQFTSDELVHISKVAGFLRSLASSVILAEERLIRSLHIYFNGLYLFAGPRTILRSHEEGSSAPLLVAFDLEGESYGKFLVRPTDQLLSERGVTLPLGYVGSILDGVFGRSDKCHKCCQNGRRLFPPEVDVVPELYNETNWERLKGCFGIPCEMFMQLPNNLIEKPLFKTLKEANYAALFHELFAFRHDSNYSWSKQDWVCANCLQELFVKAVLQWWRDKKARVGGEAPEDCRHGYYCKQQSFESGLNHARRFNHLCEPVDIAAAVAQLHAR